jgi:hypothetical protein
MIAISRSASQGFVLVVLASAAIALSCCTGCGAGNTSPSSAAASFQSSATIWFHPLPSSSQWPNPAVVGGSSDYLALFQANTSWPRALAHTQAFGIYAGWILEASDQQLQGVVAFLNAHNIVIELEAPALQALSTCGTGVEGYVPYGQSVQTLTLAYLQRLQSLGAQVSFIKVDEPYFFGNVVNDPRSCHFSVEQIASEVGEYVQLVHEVYPNAAVGDVEPVIGSAYTPDVVTALGQWHATYQSVTGAPFPFFIADNDFSDPTWPSLAKNVEVETNQNGIKFGIIYIGDPTDTSDAEWTGKAVARFKIYQGESGGQPDYVLFQSWEPYPQFCLPETDPTTFTGVLDAYLDATM